MGLLYLPPWQLCLGPQWSDWQGKTTVLKPKTCPIVILPTKNPTHSIMQLNPGLCSDWGMAQLSYAALESNLHFPYTYNCTLKSSKRSSDNNIWHLLPTKYVNINRKAQKKNKLRKFISQCYSPYNTMDVNWHIQYLGEFLILCRWFVLESVISCNTAWTWFSMTETLCVVWSWRMGGPPCSWLSVSRLLGPFISNRRTLKNDSNCNTQHYYYYYYCCCCCCCCCCHRRRRRCHRRHHHHHYSASDFYIQCKLQLWSTYSVNCSYGLHTA